MEGDDRLLRPRRGRRPPPPPNPEWGLHLRLAPTAVWTVLL